MVLLLVWSNASRVGSSVLCTNLSHTEAGFNTAHSLSHIIASFLSILLLDKPSPKLTSQTSATSRSQARDLTKTKRCTYERDVHSRNACRTGRLPPLARKPPNCKHCPELAASSAQPTVLCPHHQDSWIRNGATSRSSTRGLHSEKRTAPGWMSCR